jgi:sugar-specific transcriptional regulator TrmB
MSLNTLHENLTRFGFTREEAEFYVFLSAIGPATARTIARRFNINRVKAYRTLKDLEEKGLVIKIMGRPLRFTAQPIEGLIRDKINETRLSLQELEHNQTQIMEDLDKIKDENISADDDPVFRIYQGRQQIYELLAGMCDRVKEELMIVTTSTDFLRLSLWGIDERLMDLSKSGIKVNILIEVTESNLKEIEEIQGDLEIRHLSVPSPVRIVTMDNVETLSSVAMDDTMSMTTPNDTGLWTNAVGFTAAMQIFYNAIWHDAPSSEVMINSLKTGRKPQELITIRSVREYNLYFKSLLEHSEESIDIMVNKIQDLPLPVVPLLEEVQTKKIRILTHVEDSMSATLRATLAVADVRHNDNESKFSVIIVDGRENLLTTSGMESSIHAVWSNLEDYVQTTSLIFEDYWEKSRPVEVRFRELITEQNKMEIAQTIVDPLISDGWSVEAPGTITGATGVENPFDIVARFGERVIAVNLNIDGDGYNSLFELSSRKMDLDGVILVLGSIRELEEEVVRMSILYGITLIHGLDVKGLSEKIRSI